MEDRQSTGLLTRRVFVGTSIAGLTLVGAKPTFAQQIRLPSFEETIALLESSGGVSLIYSRMTLALSLTLDLTVRNSGAETSNPEPAAGLPVLPAERPETAELFDVISELSSAESRNGVLSTLREREDPLGDGRGEALSSLLERVAAGLAEYGLPVEEGPIADALGAGHPQKPTAFAAGMIHFPALIGRDGDAAGGLVRAFGSS